MCVVLLGGCVARSQPVVSTPTPAPDPALAREQGMARDLEQMPAQDLGSLPPVTSGYPAQLDDAALMVMVERRQGLSFWAFYEEIEWLLPYVTMDFERTTRTRYEATPLGRLERELDAHHLRWSLHRPETGDTLLALMHAAEATLLYDWEFAAHVWTHARELQPAPVAVFERLDHHFRVIRALHMGADITGPIVRDIKTGEIEVPPGIAAAAARAFPDADAGRFDSEGALALSVLRGRVVLLHRGRKQVVTAGEELVLRRLDVLRAQAAATLGHKVLGAIEVAAGSEITAGNAAKLLLPGQREQVARMVETMGGPGSEPRESIEAMLPFAYPWVRADYVNSGRESSREIIREFDGQ